MLAHMHSVQQNLLQLPAGRDDARAGAAMVASKADAG